MSTAQRIADMSEYDAKAALLTLIRVIAKYPCVEPCPAIKYCNQHNLCTDAWLDFAIKGEWEE